MGLKQHGGHGSPHGLRGCAAPSPLRAFCGCPAQQLPHVLLPLAVPPFSLHLPFTKQLLALSSAAAPDPVPSPVCRSCERCSCRWAGVVMRCHLPVCWTYGEGAGLCGRERPQLQQAGVMVAVMVSGASGTGPSRHVLHVSHSLCIHIMNLCHWYAGFVHTR